MTTKVRTFSLLRYVDTALTLADYARDEDGVVVAVIPGVSGFYAQGATFEEARANLRDVVDGNVLLALQLGLPIPAMPGVSIEEDDAQANTAQK
jgi:predicted RNase H-like HicB family nuclease